jgi:DNA polymerase
VTRVCNWDVESRATVDLTIVGAHLYWAHPDTRLLCVNYTFDKGETMKRWRVWQREVMPGVLREAFDDPECIFEGWNANFERLACRAMGYDLPASRFRCTMARARSMALPGKLELCARALQMPVQKADNSIMLKWCKPLKDGGWADDPKEYEQLLDYCDVDVLTEIGIGDLLRHLTPEEQRDWEINEAINDRGIPVDTGLAQAAQRYAKDELDEIKARLNTLTKGVVTSPKQFQRVKAWLTEWLPPELQSFVEPDPETGKVSIDAAAREELLSDENADVLVGDLREFVELIHDGGRASTAKFAAMCSRADRDQRVRGAYVFNGAGQTHRFSSHGLQVHNFIRAGLANIETVVEAVLRGVPKKQLVDVASYAPDGTFVFDKSAGGHIRQPYNVLTILSRLLRPSIVADDGKSLVWGDWSSIEAVVNPWLSSENSASELLDYFAGGGDLYLRQAVLTYGLKSEADVLPAQRQAGGKVPVLAFGFQGGAGAGMRMARAYGVSMDWASADALKVAWRRSNPWAERFWLKLELAVFNAVREPGTVFHAGRVAYLVAQSVLWCLLPSGKLLAYPFPRIETLEGRYGPQDAVTCIKGSFHPKAGSNYWPRMKLYSGILCENCTQAEAASLLRWAIRELYENDWPIIGHTHDELLCEIEEAEVDEMKTVLRDVMTSGPVWAAGLPLRAEVMSGFVYGK